MEKIQISSNPSDQLIFTESQILYRAAEIAYTDVSGVTIFANSMSVNGIPCSDNRQMIIKSNTQTIKIHLGSAFKIGNKAKQALFAEAYQHVAKYVFPPLIRNMLSNIDSGDAIQIGNLTISRRGISKQRLLFGEAFLSWEFFCDSLQERGYAKIYERKPNKPNKAYLWVMVSLEKENAIVLSALLHIIHDALHELTVKPPQLA